MIIPFIQTVHVDRFLLIPAQIKGPGKAGLVALGGLGFHSLEKGMNTTHEPGTDFPVKAIDEFIYFALEKCGEGVCFFSAKVADLWNKE